MYPVRLTPVAWHDILAQVTALATTQLPEVLFPSAQDGLDTGLRAVFAEKMAESFKQATKDLLPEANKLFRAATADSPQVIKMLDNHLLKRVEADLAANRCGCKSSGLLLCDGDAFAWLGL